MQERALFTRAAPAVITSCRETQLGNTLYRVISVSEKDFDWSRTLENLAVRQAVAENSVSEDSVAEQTVAEQAVAEQTEREPGQLPGARQEKGVPL